MILFGILSCCLVLEVGLRVAAYAEARRTRAELNVGQKPTGVPMMVYDPDLVYRGNPQFPGFNSDGLHDSPHGPKTERFRVLILGDSIAMWGETVETTLVGHLRSRLLRDLNPQSFDVINAAIVGYTNYQELLYLKKYGLRFEPDLVGVQFCLNDLHKFYNAGRFFTDKSPGIRLDPQETESLVRRWTNKSYLLSWMANRLALIYRIGSWKVTQGFSFDCDPSISNAWHDGSWNDIEAQMQEMVELGRESGFSVFLFVIPIGAQYRTDYLARDRSYVLKPQRKLKEICARLRIPFYDPYPEMDTRLFLSDGLHLTPEGRRFVGESVASFVTEAELLPHLHPDLGPIRK